MSGVSDRNIVQVATIGQVGHGKSALTAALTLVLSKRFGGEAVTVEEIDAAPAAVERGISIAMARVEYDTAGRHYVHLDGRDSIDHKKIMLSGVARLDAAVLVIAAPEGVTDEARDLLDTCAQVGVSRVIVFLNKCDLVGDEGLVGELEGAARELLGEYGYAGADAPVVRGSALKALEGDASWEEKIVELSRHLDTYVPDSRSLVEGPLLMPIDSSFASAGVTALMGQIERGVLKAGDEVDIVGLMSTRRVTCSRVTKPGRVVGDGRVGETVTAEVKGVRPEEIARGQVLSRPGVMSAYTRFEGTVYMLASDEGGRGAAFFAGYRPDVHIGTAHATASLELPSGVGRVMPGDSVKAVFHLSAPLAMESGTRLEIQESGRTVGVGVVVKALE